MSRNPTQTPMRTAPVRPSIGTPRAERLARLRKRMTELELDAVIVSRPANSRYLSGFRLARGEAETAGYSGTLFVTAFEQLLLVDFRYLEQAATQVADGWRVVRTAAPMPIVIANLLADHGVLRLGLEAESLVHARWAALAESAPGTELHAIDAELAELRIVKEPAEVAAIEAACQLGDQALVYLLDRIRPGVTERALAAELERFFVDNHAEGTAFDPIVLVGPRAAMPHGAPGSTPVEAGSVLLLDYGCQVDGYRSDMTRTLFVGEVSEQVRRLHEIVRDAQQRAIEAVRPGVSGASVDAVARQLIEESGHAEHFGHGVGHGIGLETHEAPRLLTFEAPLREGMVFSVEPGIYLAGVAGIRIEDIVVVEAHGARRLTASRREAVTI
ncbi:MAG: Xaa-Pro peptidase family protein [Chloroflexota bacterium]|nr:Xaa-Pro peptidase family protein [Chloroflexota bacterium]